MRGKAKGNYKTEKLREKRQKRVRQLHSQSKSIYGKSMPSMRASGKRKSQREAKEKAEPKHEVCQQFAIKEAKQVTHVVCHQKPITNAKEKIKLKRSVCNAHRE